MNAHCKRAIKILEQYERLARQLRIKRSDARIAHLNGLRDAGAIKSTDLPARLRSNFPGEFAGMTLDAIRQACKAR